MFLVFIEYLHKFLCSFFPKLVQNLLQVYVLCSVIQFSFWCRTLRRGKDFVISQGISVVSVRGSSLCHAVCVCV